MTPHWIGQSNPLDEHDKKEHEEYFFGKWVTKDEFIELLNESICGRAAFVEEEHYNGRLHLSIKFGGEDADF